MKDQVIDLIQEIATEEGGVLNTLFGCEEVKEHFRLNINWIFNKHEIKESIKIILEHIVSQVLQAYNAYHYEPRKQTIDSDFREISFDGKVEVNRFLPINFEITDGDVKFADLENYLDKIEVVETDHQVYFKWKFPIYVIGNKTINTY